MWLFTETGFVSAVCESKDSNTMAVRSRDKQSLEELALISGTEILELPNRDYPYRVIVSKEILTNWMTSTIADAGYTNFKSHIYQTRGEKFEHALHDVWATMHKVTDTAKAKARSLYY